MTRTQSVETCCTQERHVLKIIISHHILLQTFLLSRGGWLKQSQPDSLTHGPLAARLPPDGKTKAGIVEAVEFQPAQLFQRADNDDEEEPPPSN